MLRGCEQFVCKLFRDPCGLAENAYYQAHASDLLDHAGGATRSLLKSEVKKPQKVQAGLALCIVLPSLIFALVYYARAMWVRYQYPWLSVGIATWFFLMVLFTGAMALGSCLGKNKTGDSGLVSFLLFFTCLLAWAAAFYTGDITFHQYTENYYGLMRLNTYRSVDPQKSNGQQVMDAGVIEFTPGSSLDLRHSIGFKDGDVYCVAPVMKNGTGIGHGQTHVDFWAVGVNCCSGKAADFSCGEYKMASTRSGVRLVNDDQRQFFRLAVQKAEAQYNIQATNPIFLHWIGTPSEEVNALYDDYIGSFIKNVFGFVCIQLFIVAAAAIVFAFV